MNYERERKLAEHKALDALDTKDWPMAAYSLFSAARMTLGMANQSHGRTRTSLHQLAQDYEQRGDQALNRASDVASTETAPIKSDEASARGADENQWVLVERPDTRLDDVAGMDEMKQVIQDHVVLPMKYADVYAAYKMQPGAGVLMYGPPGTGKTFIARAIAGELDAAFISVEMRKVLSKWFGETEQLIAQMFDTARKHPRCVLFFDEAEALFPKRSSTNSSVMARVVPQLLQLINGIDPAKNTIILLGATNRPWLMDEAATRPGRFGRLVYVGLPDLPAREYMLRRALRDVPVQSLDYASLAERTVGYSGSDLVGDKDSVATEARLAAVHRTITKTGQEGGANETNPEPVTMTDFQAALRRVQPSVREEDILRLEKFRSERG